MLEKGLPHFTTIKRGIDAMVEREIGAARDRGDHTYDATYERANKWIDELQSMGLALKLLHESKVARCMATTNGRLYAAFQQIDACDRSPGNWASKYSVWMEQHLQTQGAAVRAAVQSIISTHLPPKVLVRTKTNKDGKSTGEDRANKERLEKVTAAYPPDSFSFDISKLLTWTTVVPPEQVITIKKRDGIPSGATACTVNLISPYSGPASTTAEATGSTITPDPADSTTFTTSLPASLTATITPGPTVPSAAVVCNNYTAWNHPDITYFGQLIPATDVILCMEWTPYTGSASTQAAATVSRVSHADVTCSTYESFTYTASDFSPSATGTWIGLVCHGWNGHPATTALEPTLVSSLIPEYASWVSDSSTTYIAIDLFGGRLDAAAT